MAKAALFLLQLFAAACAGDINAINTTYGFFFLTLYDKPVPAELVFQQIRRYHPSPIPIYILSDVGGADLRYLCGTDLFCTAKNSTLRYALPGSDHGQDWQETSNQDLLPTTVKKLENLFMEMKIAAQWMKTEYLITMQEDVWVNGPLEAQDIPLGDVGGIQNPWFQEFAKPAQEYIANKPGAIRMHNPRVIFEPSYYKVFALIDCVDRVLHTIDWSTLHTLDRRIGVRWDTVPPVLFALGGYVIRDWRAACEHEHPYGSFAIKRHCYEAPLMHQHNNPAFRAIVKLYGMHEDKRIKWNNHTKLKLVLLKEFDAYIEELKQKFVK